MASGMSALLFPPAEPEVEAVPAGPTSRFVCFVLDGQSYGMAVGRIREVLRLCKVASVPGAPAACLGVINLRGRIVSVLDLRQMLRLAPAQQGPQSRLLVVDHPQGQIALQVDRVMDLLSVANAQIERPPAVNSVPGLVTGIVQRTTGALLLLDPEQLLGGKTAQEAA